MAHTVAVHSYRGGTGKSNACANVAALWAAAGHRVALVDVDIQSPGVHALFGLDADNAGRTLNDFLWGRSPIAETAHDVTAQLGPGASGQLFLVPCSIQLEEIGRVLREGLNLDLLMEGLESLGDTLGLDTLVLDTHPGLSQETLLLASMAETLVIVLRPDQQDYQGTAVTVEVARELDIPRLLLLVNKTPPVFAEADVRAKVEATYGCPVTAVLPHSDEMMALASAGVFVTRYPAHPMTETYRQVAAQIFSRQ